MKRKVCESNRSPKDGLPLRSNQPHAKVIQLIPNQIITKKVVKKVPLRDGIAHPDIKEGYP